MAACCNDRRAIISVENSESLIESSDDLTTSDLEFLSVDVDLRSSSHWHLSASSVTGLLGGGGDVDSVVATVTLRLYPILLDGTLGDAIVLGTGANTILDERQALTLIRTKALVRGVYRVTASARVSGVASGDANVTLEGEFLIDEETVRPTTLGVVATRVYL